jgi:hypothetical protein
MRNLRLFEKSDMYFWLYVVIVLFVFEYIEGVIYLYWGHLNIGLWEEASHLEHLYHILVWYVFTPIVLSAPVLFYFFGTRRKEDLREFAYAFLYIYGIFRIVGVFSDMFWYVVTGVPYGTFFPLFYGLGYWCYFDLPLGFMLVLLFGYLKNRED